MYYGSRVLDSDSLSFSFWTGTGTWPAVRRFTETYLAVGQNTAHAEREGGTKEGGVEEKRKKHEQNDRTTAETKQKCASYSRLFIRNKEPTSCGEAFAARQSLSFSSFPFIFLSFCLLPLPMVQEVHTEFQSGAVCSVTGGGHWRGTVGDGQRTCPHDTCRPLSSLQRGEEERRERKKKRAEEGPEEPMAFGEHGLNKEGRCAGRDDGRWTDGG